MFTVEVKKVLASSTETEPMTSGSRNVYVAEFQFSNEWAYLERTAVFRNGETIVNVLLDDTNKCMIPWEVLTEARTEVECGAFGVKDGNVVLPTIWTSLGKLLEGVVSGVAAADPTPDVYEQILARLNKLEQEGTGGGTPNFKMGHTLKLTDDTLDVNTTDNFDGDNTLPMTAAGVNAIVGNIEVLLGTI